MSTSEEPKKKAKKAKKETKEAATMKGLKYRLKEIPELKMAIISELFANLEVNHIIAKNKNMG